MEKLHGGDMMGISKTMKRAFCFFMLLTLSFTMFFGCAGEKFSVQSLEKYMEAVDPYIQGLNADTDPGYIKVGEYDALIKQGKVVHMWGPQKGRTYVQNLNDPETAEIAERLLEEYSIILPIVQECLKKGYCSEPGNDPYAAVLYDIYVFLTEEGVARFPDSDRITRISVAVSNSKVKQDVYGAVLVQKTFLKPRGLRVCIDYNDGTFSDYRYGAVYDYGYDEDK